MPVRVVLKEFPRPTTSTSAPLDATPRSTYDGDFSMNLQTKEIWHNAHDRLQRYLDQRWRKRLEDGV